MQPGLDRDSTEPKAKSTERENEAPLSFAVTNLLTVKLTAAKAKSAMLCNLTIDESRTPWQSTIGKV
jgi:hypothetical protein